jgi:hypothetical protein
VESHPSTFAQGRLFRKARNVGHPAFRQVGRQAQLRRESGCRGPHRNPTQSQQNAIEWGTRAYVDHPPVIAAGCLPLTQADESSGRWDIPP